MARITDRAIVSYSGGKDSAAVLDLACRYFKTVYAFHMHFVKGLSFQEAQIAWAERRYGIEIVRLPHFGLSDLLRYGSYRQYDMDVPIVSPNDVYEYVRGLFDCWWVAGGERINDSIWGRAMLKHAGGSVDEQRGRFYPVLNWNKAELVGYIKARRIKVSPESGVLGHSYRSLNGKELSLIKQYYPADFQKVLQWFPLAEASAKQYECYGKTD